eukprot:328251-Pelagomonas_calceolata.AAC.9
MQEVDARAEPITFINDDLAACGLNTEIPGVWHAMQCSLLGPGVESGGLSSKPSIKLMDVPGALSLRSLLTRSASAAKAASMP